jgi:hypothetical protein
MDDDQQPDEFAVPRPPLRQGLRKRPRASASLPDWNELGCLIELGRRFRIVAGGELSHRLPLGRVAD